MGENQEGGGKLKPPIMAHDERVEGGPSESKYVYCSRTIYNSGNKTRGGVIEHWYRRRGTATGRLCVENRAGDETENKFGHYQLSVKENARGERVEPEARNDRAVTHRSPPTQTWRPKRGNRQGRQNERGQ